MPHLPVLPRNADRKALASMSLDSIATFNPMHYS